jgi:cyclic pyranopterin phosphate synthase
MTENRLTHTDHNGKAHMVNVGSKTDTNRVAVAEGEIILSNSTLLLIKDNQMKKGDVLTVSQIAGILAAKKTAEMIPLCHPIPIDGIDVRLEIDETIPGVKISATVSTFGKTGAEMEAMMAVSMAALTVYDMVKAVERNARIGNIHLKEKHGGQSGDIFNE